LETINLLTIISIAIVGSFGHCIGMCGGIVIAYSSTKIDTKWKKTHQALAHLFYSFGRITTYTFFGALFGFIGSVISFSNMANGILLLIAGLIMILVGASFGGKIKFLTYIEHSIQNSTWYHIYFKKLLQSEYLSSFYFLGLLNGLLPCGFVYFFAITAASTTNAFDGALVMFVFGLSTIPAMFSLGFFVGIFKKTAIRNTMIRIAAISVIAYGGYTIYNGYNYIINPNKTLLDCHK
jgi:hypothetical protein